MLDVVQIAGELMREASVTPYDANCQQQLATRLKALNFAVETFNCEPVSNLWATHGQGTPVLLFAGHTDVVASGNETLWSYPPFTPTVSNGILYGRGAVDMKGSIAAMLCACESFLQQVPDHKGTLAFLITSGEEGEHYAKGTPYVLKKLSERQQDITWCILGEPSSNTTVGDVVRIGRRGSLHGHIQSTGLQGHVAYPDKARNAIHQAAPWLQALSELSWQDGDEHFPNTSLQITNLQAGIGSLNVVPGHLSCRFNIRFGNTTADALKRSVETLLQAHDTSTSIDWHQSAAPFISKGGALQQAASKAIAAVQAINPVFDTGGGTSDGRFLIHHTDELIELGLRNHCAHQIDEHTAIDDLKVLQSLYQRILHTLLAST